MRSATARLVLHSREGLALLFALAVVLLAAFLSYRGWAAFGRYADQLEKKQEIAIGTSALLSSLGNAETGQRGFLLTGDDRYLAPYRQARAEIPALLQSLETITEGRPDQARRVAALVLVVNEKTAELALTIELRRAKGAEAALAVVHTDQGRLLMDQARKICSEIQAVSIGRLRRDSNQARSSGDEGGLISVLGCATLFFLLVAASRSIQKETARRQAVIAELRQSERRLQKTAAEADAANLAKSIFLSTMSHEIRTPLNAILGYAQLMLRDPGMGDDSKANLKIICRSGEHLLTLINAVLDMSKIEAGRTEIKLTTFNLPKLLEDLAAMFRLRAQAKNLAFEMALDGETVPYVVADEGKLRQVLINLLGNAVKFTKRGEVKLHVHLNQKTTQSLWLSATVEDSGLGISAEDQEKLFEPFTQAKGELNTQEGTGLGLAISRKFVRLMGGDITVSSILGKGTRFQLEIPIECGHAGVALALTSPRRVKGLRAGTPVPRILVADDQLENRNWLVKLLTLIGFSVQGADNGQAAIKRWQEWAPDLILMDVHMPVMDGLEATRRIKADPRGGDTAIVALTASALDEDRRAVAESHADDFVAKPCREDELLEKMRSLLKIDYDYEEEIAAGDLLALSTASLAQLPLSLAEELRNATADGNKRLLDQLILQVRDSAAAPSANALQALADNYDYDALTRLLEQNL
jgi:signal transduction histidine kinase/DNA-binding response OmpR family regulator